MTGPAGFPCPICGGDRFDLVYRYDRAPEGEIGFKFAEGSSYQRDLWRCQGCGHFLSRHQMDMGRLYQGDYVDATYGEDRVAATFKRIISLPPGQSDNEGRVRRLVQFARRHLQLTDGYTPKVLDVGSGLCVFLHRLAREGWACLALDPDPRMAAHARRRVGVPAVCGEFLSFHNLGLFEVVAFNKVLEHVTDPVGMLAHARNFLRPGGFVYLEVPDGEAAWEAGPGREEFFIEHYHVFSWKSVANLVTLAGYDLLNRERLREPSGKFTLRVFSGIRCGQEQRELSP